MKLTKQLCKALYARYIGRCTYCGDPLPNRWHAKPIVLNWWNGTCEHPERHTLENFKSSCPSCNIIKISHSLKAFRKVIGRFFNSLIRDSDLNKFANRYVLLLESEIEVRFYFEKSTTDI